MRWCRFQVAMSPEAFEVLAIAYERIESTCGKLPDAEPVAWGIVLELLAADYLAGLHGMTLQCDREKTIELERKTPKLAQ